MKLTLEQRTKFFNLIRNKILKNKKDILIISSDYPNKSFVYMDDKYIITLYYNQFGFGITTNDVLLISLHEKNSNNYIKFDSGDYIFMKNKSDFYKLIKELNENIFKTDVTDTTHANINKILNNY
jgi:hypothetical protein